MQEIPNKGFTHGGKFHADDVFSTAFLKILNPDFTYTRGFQVPENFSGIVYDIGFGPFDHHQSDAPVRENGKPYAAFGLLWNTFGEYLLEEKDVKKFDATFVQMLDYSDNTGNENEISNLIESFNPVWDSDGSEEEAFSEAVVFAKRILEIKLENIKAINRAEIMIEKALEQSKDKIVILEKRVPWKQVLVSTETEFVIYPSNRGGYAVQGVQRNLSSPELKVAFPKSWRGLPREELAEISGVEGLLFCHKSGFLITVQTIEEGIACCNIARRQS